MKKDREDQPNVYIFRTGFDLDNLNTQDHNRKGYYYLIDIESRSRISFIPEEAKPNAPIMPQMMKDIILGIADFVIPIEGGYIVYTGKDFSGEESSRLAAAGFTIWDLSAGKVTKSIKVIGKVSSPAIEGMVKTFKGKVVRETAEKTIELVGKYDWGLVRKYFKHIQTVTGRDVHPKQIEKLKEALRKKEYKRLSVDDTELHRIEFNKKRLSMIKEWEKQTGQK